MSTLNKINVFASKALYDQHKAELQDNEIAIVPLPNFVTIEQGDARYMKKGEGAGDYLTIENAANTYLSKTDASSTYLNKIDASSTYLSKTDASSTYLAITGGTITGTISTSTTPTKPTHVANKQYVDQQIQQATTNTSFDGGVL